MGVKLGLSHQGAEENVWT